MNCPNCSIAIHPDWQLMKPHPSHGHLPFDVYRVDGLRECVWDVHYCVCPACHRLVLALRVNVTELPVRPEGFIRVWPRHEVIKPPSEHVTADVAADYAEAKYVLEDSPKSSAALSRRLLQRVLVERGGAPRGDLSAQIDYVMTRVPSYIQQSLDGVRTVGNFAAHPIKSQHAGEIFDVEPGEAEWSLGTLESVIDFYYVQPALEAARRDAHHKKLADAGKPIKTPPPAPTS